MEKKSFVLKGNVAYSRKNRELCTVENGYIVCVDGVSKGVFAELPKEYKDLPLKDYGNKLIIPGLNDIHVHAPQYTFRGLGMDLELLDWLNTHTFPEESKYKDIEYADKAYDIFVDDLKKGGTTRAVIFATMHVPATELLMDKIEAAGLKCYVGKVNMDRNSADYLCEMKAENSLESTKKWLEDIEGKYENVKPVLTPRFTPTCSDELMEGLGDLQKKYDLPVQSHLSENFSEIAWVKDLCPWSTCYGDAYDHFGLFGNGAKTVMAHCVHSTDEEVDLMDKNGVFIAHCPQSNANLSSGIAPVRKYLDRNMHVGLGSDVAGGSNLSMFRAMQDAIACSKLRWRIQDESLKPLTAADAFYMATLGGGEYFGKVGSFEEGYELDALVLDDSGIRSVRELNIADRVERFIYLASEGGKIDAKFVGGNEIF